MLSGESYRFIKTRNVYPLKRNDPDLKTGDSPMDEERRVDYDDWAGLSATVHCTARCSSSRAFFRDSLSLMWA